MAMIDDVMEVTNVLGNLMMAIVILDFITLIVLYFMEKYDPRVFIAWALILIFLPPVGFILYMYMGCVIYDRHLFRPRNINRDSMEAVLSEQRELVDKRVTEDDDGRMHIVKALFNTGGADYSENNSVRVFTEGEDKMGSLFEDLRNARKCILFEYYIIRDDSRGNELLEILTQKVREGLEVRLLVDGFGIAKGPKKAIADFKAAGGHYGVFHSGAKLFFSPKKNNRNHRKIAIIDGRIAYCGGFNIGDEYQGEGPLGHWRDASVRIIGDAVASLIVRFTVDWQYSVDDDGMRYIGEYVDQSISDNDGDVRMQVVSGGPEMMPNNAIQMQYLAMIENARKRLYICTPYLVPDDTMMVCLKNAARSGVDIRIIIPDKPDHIFMYWNNLTYAYDLMRSGVRVYRYNHGFIHEKMMLMDDDVVSVGSANLDNRSITLNFETNIMMYSRQMCDQMLRQFTGDLEDCTEYTCEDYENRTLMESIRTRVSYMFKYLS